MKIVKPVVLAFLLMLLAVTVVRAALVTSLPGPTTVIDFSQFAKNPPGFIFPYWPVDIGPSGTEIVFTSTFGGSCLGNGEYPLGDNGKWTAPLSFSGLSYDPGTMTYTFKTAPVAGVGGFMNYIPGAGDVVISVLDADGDVLESYNISQLMPISTPGATNAGAFRGIARDQADIYAFTVSNGFAVLTDLTFTSTPVPLPGAVWLLGTGLLGLAAMRKKFHR